MVGHVLRLLDGPLAPVRCSSRVGYARCEDCPNEETCIVHATMIDVRNAMSAILDARSLADMRDAAVQRLAVPAMAAES